jgi:penicillin amidase
MRKLILALLLAAPSFAATGPEALARSVTIYRDTYGVPHVYAKTDAGAVFGLMYAQAEDNFWQLETDYIGLLGRRAEVEGAAGLMPDLLVRAWEVEKGAKEHYAHASPQLKELCDAFAAGLNYYLAKHPEVHPRLLARFEPWFALAEEHHGPSPTLITPAERAAAFPVLAGAPPTGLPPANPNEGSNMWAVAPSRSADGHALLLINPHVQFFGGGQRYEAHLHSNQGLDVSGFSMLGAPYIWSGHNRYLGWSHTNNYAQTADVYLESSDVPGDPLVYRYGNAHRRAVEWTDTIRVKTDNGFETLTVTFRKTHHGPVLGVRNGQMLAVRAAEVEGGRMEESWIVDKARNLREFQAALARRAYTGSNTIYADVKGNIYYLHGNAVPRRATKFDWSKPVDGSDPETEWRGLHTIDELPHVLNPKSGWVQNCNSTPFLTSGEGDNPKASDYPAYMAPEADTPRSQRSREILQGTGRFTFAEWTRLGLDTKVGIAPARIAELKDALKEVAPERSAKLADLLTVLEKWDHVGRNDSVATTLFVRTEEARRAKLGPVAALEKVKADLEAAWGTWQVAWGDVNRLERIHTSGRQEQFSDDKPSLPVPGAPTFTGTIFTFGTRAPSGQKRQYGTVGDTYIAVVDFGKKPVARSLLVFGQSADPSSKHFFDQGKLYSTQQFKPAWFTLPEIRKHTERKYRP